MFEQDSSVPLSTTLISAEYSALREEMLQLSNGQYQFITLALVAFGALLPVGIQLKNAAILFTYPILVLPLVASWLNNDRGIYMLGRYIETYIEIKVGLRNIGWEHISRTTRPPHAFLAFLAPRTVFSATQLLAFLVGLPLMLADVNTTTLTTGILALLSMLACFLWSARLTHRLHMPVYMILKPHSFTRRQRRSKKWPSQGTAVPSLRNTPFSTPSTPTV